jgi:hypothetical protein
MPVRERARRAAPASKETGAGLVTLPAMPEYHNIDGIRLDRADYSPWDKTILQDRCGDL